MSTISFESTDLRLFLSICDQLSLTKAASRMHMSLATVSNRLRKMEDKSKCRLLDRHPRGVTVTAAGDALAKHARLILRQLELLNLQLTDFAKGLHGHVNILANTTGCTEIMPAVLTKWLSLYPHVSVSLKEGDNMDVARALREGRADVGILAGTLDLTGLEVRCFASDQIVLMVPAVHALATRESISFAETLDHASVSLHENSSLSKFIAERVDDIGMPPRRHRAEVNSFEALCLMVQAGVGFGLAGNSIVRRYKKTIGIIGVPLSDQWAIRNRYVASRDLSAAPQFVVDLVSEIAALAMSAEVVSDGARM